MFFTPKRQLISAGIYETGGKLQTALCEKKDNAPQSITMHSLISIIPLVLIAGREREKLQHARRPRLAVSSLTALLKAKGWIAVCSPALPFGLAQNCGSVMSIDPNAHTGHQRQFPPHATAGFHSEVISPAHTARILLHRSKVQLQGSIQKLDRLYCPWNEIFGAGN